MENARTLSLLVILFLACAGAQQPPADQPWRVELQSSGGITGRGAGAMRSDSAGTVSVTTMSGKTCPVKLSDEEWRTLRAAVAQAKPEAWQTPKREDLCCDRIEWSLELTLGTTKHTAVWIDDPKFAMPRDLRALTDALSAIRAAHMAECR